MPPLRRRYNRWSVRYICAALFAASGVIMLVSWSVPLIGLALLGLAFITAWPDGRRLRANLGQRDAKALKKERRRRQGADLQDWDAW